MSIRKKEDDNIFLVPEKIDNEILWFMVMSETLKITITH